MEIEIKDINLIINILSTIKNGEEYYISKDDTPEVEYARIRSCAKYIKENKLAKFVGIFIDGISIQIIKENGLLFLDSHPTAESGHKPKSKLKILFSNIYVSGVIIALVSTFIIWLISLLYHRLQQ